MKTAYSSTPPRSVESGRPLTPPPSKTKTKNPNSNNVDHVIRAIKGPPVGWLSVPRICRVEFERLEAYIAKSYSGTNARLDYTPSRKVIDIRMLTTVHEFFSASFVSEIDRQFKEIAAGVGAEATFAKGLRSGGSTTLQLADGGKGLNLRSPDGLFKHVDASYPGMVIEVSFAQKREQLKYLADDYILGSEGNIRMMLGLDIEYRQSKRATFSIWRRALGEDKQIMVAKEVISEQEFRSADGLPGEPGITFYLSDMALPSLLKAGSSASNPTRSQIHISAETLCQFLAEAERAEEQGKGKVKGEEERLQPGVVLGRRKRTPDDDSAEDGSRDSSPGRNKRLARDEDYHPSDPSVLSSSF